MKSNQDELAELKRVTGLIKGKKDPERTKRRLPGNEPHGQIRAVCDHSRPAAAGEEGKKQVETRD